MSHRLGTLYNIVNYTASACHVKICLRSALLLYFLIRKRRLTVPDPFELNFRCNSVRSLHLPSFDLLQAAVILPILPSPPVHSSLVISRDTLVKGKKETFRNFYLFNFGKLPQSLLVSFPGAAFSSQKGSEHEFTRSRPVSLEHSIAHAGCTTHTRAYYKLIPEVSRSSQ